LMDRLLAFHGRATWLARTAPETLKHPEVARVLEQALIHVMVRCWSAGTSVEPRASVRRHSAIIARLEDLLAENNGSSICRAEICPALGVSERILRICCHGQLGLGPVRFLWLRRMHFARRALTRADSALPRLQPIMASGSWGAFRCSIGFVRR